MYVDTLILTITMLEGALEINSESGLFFSVNKMFHSLNECDILSKDIQFSK